MAAALPPHRPTRGAGWDCSASASVAASCMPRCTSIRGRRWARGRASARRWIRRWKSRRMPPEVCVPDAGDVVRVMLVDDHPLFRQGLRQVIDAHAGMQVISEAADGAEALVQFQAQSPDLVVVDVHMPDM